MAFVYPLMLQTEIYDLLNEIFLSVEIWGLIGPTALVILSLYLAKKDSFLGLMMILVTSLFAYTYLGLIENDPFYWWHSFILMLGLISCTFTMIAKRR